MIIILKNITNEIIILKDIGITFPPSGTYRINSDEDKSRLTESNELISNISLNKIQVSTDLKILSPVDGIRQLFTDAILVGPRDVSGKIRVHQTSRKLGLVVYFSGAGDDISNINDVGNGAPLEINHKVGQLLEQSAYMDFNIVKNETWLHEGYIIWKNTDFDYISGEIVTRSVSVTPGTNTFYNLYNGYLIIPAAGNGNYEITSDITDPVGGLVYMPSHDDGSRPTAFWNADWNNDTNRYENITPAPTGDGFYNMFANEVSLFKFFNRVPLIGDGFQKIQSSDTDRLGQGMRLKMTAYTNTSTSDHDWKMATFLAFNRKHTLTLS